MTADATRSEQLPREFFETLTSGDPKIKIIRIFSKIQP